MQTLSKVILNRHHKQFSALAILLFLIGCEGGIVGTGEGSKDTAIYQLIELPERISPDIPKHLESSPQDSTDGSSDGSSKLSMSTKINSLLRILNPGTRAESWEVLNSELTLLAILRLNAQHSITLADLAFDDIASSCEQINECVIPAGDIRVKYTQPVINRLVKLYTDTLGNSQNDQQSQSEYLRDVISKLSQLLDYEVIFGETSYFKLGGNPYDYQIKTSLKQLDIDHEFTVQWRDDKSVTELISRPFANVDESYVLSHFYQAGSPGESVIAKLESTSEGGTATLNIKVISNNLENSGILLEAHDVLLGGESSSTTQSTTPDIPEIVNTGTSEVEVVDSIDVDQSAYTFRTIRIIQGQLDNDGGYATVEEYDIPDDSNESIDYIRLFRETFDGDGFLLAGEICLEYSATNRCDTDSTFTVYGPSTAAIVDSTLYYPSEDYPILESLQDAIRWKVVNLPIDIREFAVVSNETGTALSDRIYLCLGYQVVPGSSKLFCGATDDQLNGGTEIISVTPGEPVRLIPDARLLQAD